MKELESKLRELTCSSKDELKSLEEKNKECVQAIQGVLYLVVYIYMRFIVHNIHVLYVFKCHVH